jgi:succinate dehydrogenase / fumarate reductase membrane anchor subunit
MPIDQIGPKRLVVGAHYGLKEWIIQRVTAIVMVVFTIVLLVDYCITGSATYEASDAFGFVQLVLSRLDWYS